MKKWDMNWIFRGKTLLKYCCNHYTNVHFWIFVFQYSDRGRNMGNCVISLYYGYWGMYDMDEFFHWMHEKFYDWSKIFILMHNNLLPKTEKVRLFVSWELWLKFWSYVRSFGILLDIRHIFVIWRTSFFIPQWRFRMICKVSHETCTNYYKEIMFLHVK